MGYRKIYFLGRWQGSESTIKGRNSYRLNALTATWHWEVQESSSLPENVSGGQKPSTTLSRIAENSQAKKGFVFCEVLMPVLWQQHCNPSWHMRCCAWLQLSSRPSLCSWGQQLRADVLRAFSHPNLFPPILNFLFSRSVHTLWGEEGTTMWHMTVQWTTLSKDFEKFITCYSCDVLRARLGIPALFDHSCFGLSSPESETHRADGLQVSWLLIMSPTTGRWAVHEYTWPGLEKAAVKGMDNLTGLVKAVGLSKKYQENQNTFKSLHGSRSYRLSLRIHRKLSGDIKS